MAARSFVVWDYVVFGVFLALSSFVGIFYAVKDFRKKSAKTEDYLVAKRKMHCIPVALSLTVSFMSAVTILGTSKEVYLNGLVFWWLLPSFLIAAVIISEIYIPIFYRLKIISSYQYLELRFNRVVRILATTFFILETIMYVGVVIYAPALAIEEVTGFGLWAAVLSTGFVCTFYTTLGGLKGVIWTDVLQILILGAGLLAIIIQGSIELGGFTSIWNTASEGGRINMVETRVDPRVRHSIWSLLVGGTFLWLGLYAASQSQVQRYLSCRTEKQAKVALYLNFIGLFAVISFTCMCGLVTYAFYQHCDPISTGQITVKDQLLPFLVMDLLGKFPGLPGIFVACVYSGSLSTVSTGINAMACVTVEDFIKPFSSKSDNVYVWLSRGLGIVYGLLAIGMAWLTSVLGGEVLVVAISVFGIVNGPLMGVFTLGIFLPFANSWGAVAGLVSGLVSTIWIYIGSRIYKSAHAIVPALPRSTEHCPITMLTSNSSSTVYTTESLTPTLIPTTESQGSSIVPASIVDLYSMSYLYLSCFGFLVTLIVGIIVSLISCGHRDARKVDPQLMFSLREYVVSNFFPSSYKSKKGRCTKLDIDETKC